MNNIDKEEAIKEALASMYLDNLFVSAEKIEEVRQKNLIRVLVKDDKDERRR